MSVQRSYSQNRKRRDEVSASHPHYSTELKFVEPIPHELSSAHGIGLRVDGTYSHFNTVDIPSCCSLTKGNKKMAGRC